jgi:heptosyltransferase-3
VSAGLFGRLGMFALGVLVFALAIVWQQPNVVTARLALSLILLLGIAVAAAGKRQELALRDWLRPLSVRLYLLLTLWLFADVLLLSAYPGKGLAELWGQWIRSGLLAVAGAGCAWLVMRRAGPLSPSGLLLVVAAAFLGQVAAHDLIASWLFLKSGSPPFHETPVIGGTSYDVFSYVNVTAATFLVAEFLNRRVHGRRCLPVHWIVLVGGLALCLLCTYYLQARNGTADLLLLIGGAGLMLLWHYRGAVGRGRLAAAAVVLALALAGLAVTFGKSDPRWASFSETLPIALDTAHSKAWLNPNKYPLPKLSSGADVDLSLYLRAAWAREGIKLVAEHPLGLGFSRTAFGEGLFAKYGEGHGGHSHSGLLDFTIANGIPGLLLWIAFLSVIIRDSWRRFFSRGNPYAPLLLFLVAGFLVRSVVDSNMRDHMLEQFMFLVGLVGTLMYRHEAEPDRPGSNARILVIRRDNIGDLICTTPLIRALRQHFPVARIDALVNSYNRPVLDHNEDLDHVYAYTKAKHRSADESVVGVYWRRVLLMLSLRRLHYDAVILANGGYLPRPLRLARWVAPSSVVGFVPADGRGQGVDLGVPIDAAPRHEVESIFRLAAPLGIAGEPPQLHLMPAPAARERARQRLAQMGWPDDGALPVAIHISARKPQQRWPAGHFAELMRRLHAEHHARFVLFWSPGDEHNPLHPGDDGKAAEILAATADLPVMPYATERLEDLIAGLSVCGSMVCSDGGAMHVAAALGLPIVCFFGNSDAATWHPWRVRYELLQKPSLDVSDISVDEAVEAYGRLIAAKT